MSAAGPSTARIRRPRACAGVPAAVGKVDSLGRAEEPLSGTKEVEIEGARILDEVCR